MKVRIEMELPTDALALLAHCGDVPEDAFATALADLAEAFGQGDMPLDAGAEYPVSWHMAGADTQIVVGRLLVLGDESEVRDDAWHDARCGGCQMLHADCSCERDAEDGIDAEPDEEQPTEPEEGDYVMHPAGPLGGCTAVSVDGRHKETFSPVGDKSADELAMEWVAADMEANQFWPNIWRQDYHGGYDLLTL